jgi:AraC-like DNA-binding protein
MWVVYFKRTLVERVCTMHESVILQSREPGRVFSRHLDPEQARRISQLLGEVEDSAGDVPRYNAGLAYFILLAWHEFSRAQAVIGGHNVHPAVERAAFLIRDQVELRGIITLAHHAGLSPSRLSRVFHRQMGVSLVSYWNRQRLERFFRLYGEGQRMSVTRAALDAGFGSYPQFYRVFREHVGCGPAEFRRGGAELAPIIEDLAE